MSAAHTGWVATSATDEATDVNDRLGTQVAKWAARNSPASADSRRSRASRPKNASRDRAPRATSRTSTGRARALRQKAMASVGASATRISGAEVDTATTATPNSARSTVGGGDVARGGEGGEAMRRLQPRARQDALAFALPVRKPDLVSSDTESETVG